MENSFSKNSGDPGDPGGAAQVSDVAPEPSLLVEDGAVLGTRVHNRGPVADEVRVSLIWELRTLETSKHIHEILEIAP